MGKGCKEIVLFHTKEVLRVLIAAKVAFFSPVEPSYYSFQIHCSVIGLRD